MKIDDIKIGKRFRRDYGDLERFAEKIKKYGFFSAVTVSSDGRLLAGGRRIAAAKLAGLKEVPVRILDNLSERDMRVIELEENLERKDLVWGETLELKAEIDRLLKEVNPRHTQKETAEQYFGETPANFSRDLELAEAIKVFPELQNCENKFQAARQYRKMKEDGQWILKHAQQKTKPKQYLWAEDHYQIGDALEEISKITANSIHFIECDPPYGLSHEQVKSEKATSIELYSDDDTAFHLALLSSLYEIAAEHSWLVLWHAISHLPMIHQCFEATEWKYDSVPAIWVKNNATGNLNPDIKLAPKYEVFTAARKGNPKLVRPRDNIFNFARVSSEDRIRHAEKPVELYAELLNLFVQPGMKILSPFLGSGNFLLACYDRDLTAFGFELQADLKPQFVERVKRRYSE